MPIVAKINKNFRFEAAHFLPNVHETHRCKNIHGHSYLITVTLKGPLDEHYGWVMDLGEVGNICKPVKNLLDHKVLNNIEGLENPTSENLTVWLIKKLAPKIPNLYSVTVKATDSVSVTIKTKEVIHLAS